MWIFIEVDCFCPFADAVRVTVPADAAEDTATTKSTLFAAAGITADPGNDTSALLLTSCTPTPVPGAGPSNATVHVSVPGADNIDWAHESMVGTGEMPVTNCDPHPTNPATNIRETPTDAMATDSIRPPAFPKADSPFNLFLIWGSEGREGWDCERAQQLKSFCGGVLLTTLTSFQQ